MDNTGKEQIWQKLLEYMETSKDFVLEQTPEVLQQALRYEKTMALLTILLMTALVSGALAVGYHFWKHPTLDKYGSREASSFIGVMVPCLVTPLLFVQLCSSTSTLIQICMAPKYYLIQLISSFAK